jgi:hypothetical protein
MHEITPELLDQLCRLIRELREESADFAEHHDDGQRWYNRGYANGMVIGLQRLLGEQLPCGHSRDDPQLLQGHELMAWGKAYRHGERMGERETYEIGGANPPVD